MAPLMSAMDLPTVAKGIHDWVVAGSGLAADHVIWARTGAARPAVAPFIELSVIAITPVGHDWERRADNIITFADLPIALVDPATDQLQVIGHGRTTGDGPIRLGVAVGGAAPGGLAANTDYWVIVIDADHVQLAASFQNTGGNYAGNPITPINITDAGSGALTLQATATTVPAGKELIRRAQGMRQVAVQIQCFAAENSGMQAMQIMTDLAASLQLYLYDLDQAGFGVADLNAAFFDGGVKLVEGRVGSILEPRAVWTITGWVASEMDGFESFVEKASIHFTETTTGEATDIQVLPPP